MHFSGKVKKGLLEGLNYYHSGFKNYKEILPIQQPNLLPFSGSPKMQSNNTEVNKA